MGQRKIPLEQEPVIAKAYLDGGSPSKMAPEYGVTLQTIKNVLRRQGVYPRPVADEPPPKVGTPEYEALVMELRQSGLRVRDIARRVKSSTTRVSAVLQRKDILPRWKRGENYKVTPEQAEEVERLYLEGQSTAELGRRFECNPRTIANVLKRRGVKRRRRGGAPPYTSDPDFISKVVAAWGEGKSQEVVASELGCSQTVVSRVLRSQGVEVKTTGSRHGRWKGGRVSHPSGYIQVWTSPDHPFAEMRTSLGYILEHRLMMAEHLGRPLRRNETVHHINGDKTDNRIENLQIRQGKHGNHECFQCADCGSRNVVPIPL